MEIISIPSIVFLVYFIIESYKVIVKGNVVALRLIPIVSGVSGGVIGIILYLFLPEIIIGGNVFESLLVGVFSGLSATGANQIYKQFLKIQQDKIDKDKKE